MTSTSIAKNILRDQPGMTGEATEWLIDQGVKLMGIDAYTFDRPFGAMVEDMKAGNKRLLPWYTFSDEKRNTITLRS